MKQQQAIQYLAFDDNMRWATEESLVATPTSVMERRRRHLLSL